MLEIIVLSILFGLLQSSEQNKYLNNDMITPCIDTKKCILCEYMCKIIAGSKLESLSNLTLT